MKIFSILLAAYIGFLSVNPILVKFNEITDTIKEEICLNTCCEKDSSCQEETCYPEEGCTSCVCGLYCFYCTINTTRLQFISSEGHAGGKRSSETLLISNYFSSCFHPPESV